jgi:antitoxin (DNA-binding transcriptional repressor) of toxin-antitoxin stability system
MSDMKIVSIREISRHFTKHAELSREGETIHVHRAGKPYVRIVPDPEAHPAAVPKVDFGERAREDFAFMVRFFLAAATRREASIGSCATPFRFRSLIRARRLGPVWLHSRLGCPRR